MNLRALAACTLALASVGCATGAGYVPMSNTSQTILESSNFKITRTALQGQASCPYLFGIIPLGDPFISTKAMDNLTQSAALSGKSEALVNFAYDQIDANFIVVRIYTVKVRADVAEFSK